MAFVAKQNIKGKNYYYLRESVREGNKVKTRHIAYLGADKKQAEKKAKEILNEMDKKIIEKKDSESIVTKVNISIDELANFCKRKGFVFRSSDIYGGLAGFWDYGPLGAELFNNLNQSWWDFFVHQKENMVGIDASVISHPLTWKASGHLVSFKDIAVMCKKCKKATKIDASEEGKVRCECGGEYEKQGEFNLLFKTTIGALETEEAYLRGETAQGMFMDFKLIYQTSRMQLPFGIAQIGKCFRNEIAPRDFLFRSREFHIGEFEFFINPEEKKCNLLDKKHLDVKLMLLDVETQKNLKSEMKKTTIKKMLEENRLEEWHAYWLAEQILWFYSIGLEEIKIREHTKDELSHYSSATFDIDYEYPFGSKEFAGNANRGQYDLTQHQKESKQDMEIFDEKIGKKILPKVIEPTFGMDRIFLAILTKAYSQNQKGEIVLKIPKKLSPVKAAVFPLVKNDDKLVKLSRKVFEELKKKINAVYDQSGSIGRRYARQDEIGTPYCITIDGDSVKNKDVTIRDRDTTKQIRVKISDLNKIIQKLFDEEINFDKAGKIIN